ncbi:selenocysteine-specific translation elongation factor [Nakamurella leprariae]|uniref:selenocysteine-specific translation elongation factor n=1 Tax=Nakamurella leprariae TaxID=2803911 RepID=UPI002E2BC190|nr:selenocysteine-specific translation elongation factor [Nakamurella leprariae]
MHVIATAGHVDHGKSTLVRALTGMEPDRLSEEQRRGMTIDLGYAWTTLPGGDTVAFVDVPGHQRFVTTMLAGVGPVPAVLFVVASDEGWNVQSTEHLDALDALQVSRGVLALTRADLGDVELAEAEARDHLAGTALADMEAVGVSAVTGAGVDDLRFALDRLVTRLPARVDGRVRLWVDRVFSVRGAGTVVTGTLTAGTITVGDELQVHPSGARVRVRGIESLKRTVDRVHGVARVALNLRGVSAEALHRGDALAAPGGWADVDVLDVRLSRAARPPTELVFHLGSAAVPAHVRPLGEDTARLTLARPLPTAIGERGVLRDPGAQQVVAAATVLDPMPPPLTRRGAARRRADELAGVGPVPDASGEVARRGAVRREDLVRAGVRMSGAPPGAVAVAGWLIDDGRWQQWRERLGPAADAWAAAHPMLPALPRRTAVDALALPDPALLEPLVGQTDLVLDASGVARPGQRASLPEALERALAQVLVRLAADPFAAPEAPDLAAVGLDDRALAVAVRQCRLVELAPGVLLRPEALDEAVRRLTGLPQPFAMTDARQVLRTTRRVAVPLLEHLDRSGRTVRVDSRLRRVAES